MALYQVIPDITILLRIFSHFNGYDASGERQAIKTPTVLIVDDEKTVRELIRTILEKEGYQVMVAPNGPEALKLSDSSETIDILITDILMPIMNGRELANRMSAKIPDLKVLFISAYSAEVLSYHHLYPDKADLIKKPFRNHVLVEKLKEMLFSGFRWTEIISKQA